MPRAKDMRIRNFMTRNKFLNESPILDMWRRQQLIFAGRISRMNINMCPKTLIKSTWAGMCDRDTHHQAARKSMVNNTRTTLPDICKDSRVEKMDRIYIAQIELVAHDKEQYVS